MRITNSMMIDNTLSNLNNGLRRVNTYHNQLASNRKIVNLSDDPVGVLNSLGARQQIRRLEQYEKNVRDSRTWVTQTETAISEMQDVIVSIKELVTASMGTTTEDDKSIYATQISQLTEQLLEMCNSSMGNQYIFGGYNTTNKPFQAVRDEFGNLLGVTYNGLDLVGTTATPANSISDTTITDPNDPDAIWASNLNWSGELSIPGTYSISSTDETLTFTNDETGETYNVTLSMPKGLTANEQSSIELVTEDGVSFGKISWKNGTALPKTSDEVQSALSQIASAVAGADSVTTSAIAGDYAAAQMGPDAQDAIDNNGLSWTGNITDTSQKYTLEADGDTLKFVNSFGSVVYSHQMTADDIANGSIDLSDKGLGVVSWTSAPAADPDDPSADTAEKALAKMIASAGFVTSKLGEEATQNIQFEIGYEIRFDVSFTGIEVVGTGENNMFNVLANLISDLKAGKSNQELTGHLTSLSNVQDRLLTCLVKEGTRTTKLDTMVNRYSLDAINYEALRSDIEDIDQAEVIMQMKYAEMIYKQALASGAQIIQPSLMDFLR